MGDFVDDEEEIICESIGSPEDVEFDMIVGAMEEILILTPTFNELIDRFIDENCSIFENSEENKLEYMDIFERYTNLVETTLENMLRERVPNFRMKRFEDLIYDRKDEIGGEVFDILASRGDFDEFKETMILAKSRLALASGPGLSVEGQNVPSSP